MSFKVDIGGVVVTCDSAADAAALMKELGVSPKAITSKNGDSPPNPAKNADSIETVVKRLPDKAKTVLRTLLRADNHTSTDRELREVLKVKDNVALAGALSPLTREAKKAGIDLDSFFKRLKNTDDPRNVFISYWITSDAVPDVKKGLKA